MTQVDRFGVMLQPNENKWPKLELSGKHQHAWLKLRASLLWNHGAFADIFLSMMVDKDKTYGWFTDKVPVAATDDKVVYINPNTFFENYTLDEQIFIVCHEICHAMFNHCGLSYDAEQRGKITYPDGVSLPYDHALMGKGMDYLINDMLVESNIGKLPKDGLYDPSLITFKDDLFTAYRKLHKQKPQQKPQPTNSGSKPQKSFDKHLAPGTGRGKTPQKAKEERSQQAWDNAIDAAMQAAKKMGKLPLALERGLSKLLEPQVDWKEHLYFEMAKKIGSDRSTWDILDNELMLRGIGAPGKQGFCCDLVVFVADSSGSINQNTLNMFMSECAGIMQELRPRNIIFMQCDAQIYDYTEIEDPDELVRPLMGGGGTSFLPPFNKVAEEGLNPDCLVYLTDLEGSFPQEAPPYPVVWATIKEHKAPFGDVVLIPKQANSGSNDK